MSAAVSQATDGAGFLTFYVAVMVGLVLIPFALHSLAAFVGRIMRGQ